MIPAHHALGLAVAVALVAGCNHDGHFGVLTVVPPRLCSGVVTEARVASGPVDLILVVDNSGSMRNKIHGVELNLNDHLAARLLATGIDYRLIVVSSFGDWTNNMICPASPLSGNACKPPVKGPPVFTPRYAHYDLNIQSNDGWQKLLEGYRTPDVWRLLPSGWSGALRPGSRKLILVVTDDNAIVSARQFDAELLTLDPVQFGTAQKRNYVFHAIIGMKGNTPPTVPWAPDDPVQMTKCGSDAENAGLDYQDLAILTGGLRFPVCEWANFDAVFEALVEQGVQAGAPACSVLVPQPPALTDGRPQQVDPDTLVVTYSSPQNPRSPVRLTKVASPAACAADSYTLGPEGDRVILCPTTCAALQADAQASLELRYDCQLAGP